MEFLQSIFGLHGRTAVVTGGSSGIGALAAATLARAGATVLVCGRRSNLLDQAGAHAGDAAARLRGVQLDLAADGAEAILSAAVEKDLGGCDILVCSAGTILRSPSGLTDPADFAPIFNLNVVMCAKVAGALLPHLERSAAPRIVNVTSMFGVVSADRGGIASYTTSKHGLIGLTRAQAVEFASRRILVNALAPGYIKTEFTEGLFKDAERVRIIESKTPLGRIAGSDELEAAILFLTSPKNSFMTGSVVTIDGGWTVW